MLGFTLATGTDNPSFNWYFDACVAVWRPLFQPPPYLPVLGFGQRNAPSILMITDQHSLIPMLSNVHSPPYLYLTLKVAPPSLSLSHAEQSYHPPLTPIIASRQTRRNHHLFARRPSHSPYHEPDTSFEIEFVSSFPAQSTGQGHENTDLPVRS